MGSGKKSSQQLKKMKKNQAKQKAAIKEAQPKEDSCQTLERHFNNMLVTHSEKRPDKSQRAKEPKADHKKVPNPPPLEEFQVRDASGKIYTTHSPAIKMLISNQRPVKMNEEGNYMFEYPGFAPFKTYLSCMYVLLDEAMETSYVYDGNGHTFPLGIPPDCMMCNNCDSVVKKPLSKRNADRIFEIELCDGHMYELLTKNGYALPTKRDQASTEAYRTKTHLPNRGPVGLSAENNQELYDVQKRYLEEDDGRCDVDVAPPPREKTVFDDVE